MKKGLLAVCTAIVGATAGATASGQIMGKQIEQKDKKIAKFKTYYNMLNQWLLLKQEGKKLEEFFLSQGYKSIAIYGMGEMGNRLCDELKNSEVKIKYAIDKETICCDYEIEVLEPDEDLEAVDVIVVTAVFVYEEIEAMLSEKANHPIISLEDVIYQL